MRALHTLRKVEKGARDTYLGGVVVVEYHRGSEVVAGAVRSVDTAAM